MICNASVVFPVLFSPISCTIFPPDNGCFNARSNESNGVENFAFSSTVHKSGIFRLNLDFFTDIKEKTIKENDLFSLFPNPSSDYIFIKCSYGTLNQNIKIYDFLGKTVWQGILESNAMQIDISSFPIGIYYLNLNGSTKLFVRN